MHTLEPVIKSEWDHFFAAVNTEEDWITPLLNAVDGVEAEAALWKPAGEIASIAEIVAHVNGHLEATLRAVLGMADQDYDDWPPLIGTGESAWTTLVERLKLTVADLHRALHNWSLDEIYGVPRGKESKRSTMVTNILVHNAYHAGQIVKLRQAFAFRRESALA